MIDHGNWTKYQPAKVPEDAPSGALFWQRADDTADWYTWSRARWSISRGIDASNTIKVVVGDDRVVTVSPDATMLSLPDSFHLYELVGEAAPELGWYLQNGRFGPERVLSFDEARAAKLAALAENRWSAERSGIVVSSIPVMTDRESQALITGAALQAFMDASYSLVWKTATGDFVTLSSAQLLAIAQAVRAHVQACFNREAALTTAIEAAGDATALAAIDISAGWPATT